MPVSHMILIALAGVGAGAINAIVGSGTLITFPTLVALGHPPVTATMSNAVGLVAGGVSGTWGYRRELRGQWHRLRWQIPASLIGALLGSWLLLHLPEKVFEKVVPVLLVLALGLIFAEFFAHAHGALAIGGVGLLGVAGANLVDQAQAPGAVIALWVVLLIVLALATFVALGAWLALRSRERPAATGQEMLVGQLAQVRQRLDPDGMVFVDGALWQAVSEDGEVEDGDWVRVVAVHNLRLIVRRIDTESPA